MSQLGRNMPPTWAQNGSLWPPRRVPKIYEKCVKILCKIDAEKIQKNYAKMAPKIIVDAERAPPHPKIIGHFR